jgi:hypothetical protein
VAFTGNWATNTYKNGLNMGLFNLGVGTTDAYKIALYTNTATLDADTTAYTATGEASGGNYIPGGQILVISTVPTTDANTTTSYLSFSNASWTGAITARGALIYKYNGTTNPAMVVLDFGSNKTSTTTFTVQFPSATNTSAIIRIA